jgi:cytochrome b561
MIHKHSFVAAALVLAALFVFPTLALADGHASPADAGSGPAVELTEGSSHDDDDHAVPYGADGIIGVLLLAITLVAAASLNHATPGRRVVGTFLAAAMTLGVGLTIGWLHFSGVLDNPRPPSLPTDELKPGLIRLLGLAFTLSGLFLLVVTYWQTKRDDVLALGTSNEAARFGRASRVLHWTTAIFFVALIPMGVFMTMIPEEAWYRPYYYGVHKSLGFTVLLLVLVRLVWHRKSPVPALDGSLKTWERRSAHTAHVLLYALMIGFPITGFVMSTFAGKASQLFFWDLPLFWAADDELIVVWGLLHKIVLPILFYVVFAAHIAGALKHQFIDKHDDAFKRMVT